MFGTLPTSLTVGGKSYPINTDFRNCLTILCAYSDEDLTDVEKTIILLTRLYGENSIQEMDIEEALIQANWFLDGGIDNSEDLLNDNKKSNAPQPRLYDWQQDEQMIFSAINRVAGKEIRALDYMHFWTFLGLFNEIGECQFSTVVSIRNKKLHHKKLEQWEKDFYKSNKNIIDLKHKSEKNLEEINAINKLLGRI